MEAVWFKSGRHLGGLTGELPVVVCLSLCRRDVPYGFEQAMVVEARYPFERSELDRFLGFPWSPAVNQFGLALGDSGDSTKPWAIQPRRHPGAC